MMATALVRRSEAESDQEETTMPLTPEGLFRQIEIVDNKHEDAHKRLRESIREIDAELVLIKKAQSDASEKFAAYAATPPDVMKLRFTPSTVVAVCAVCISIVGGFWASTSGLRSDLRDMATVDVANRKLQDERAATFRDSLESLKRQQELQRYETQAVKDLVNALTKERSR
jgi:hypothetical protein